MGKIKSAILLALMTILIAALCFISTVSFSSGIKYFNSVVSLTEKDAYLGGNLVDGETYIGNDVTIGHGAILHGCVIGNGSLVGMGAIVLDGAKIGRRCMIAAGALVTAKMDASEGSLIVGSPARVIRKLTEDELDHMKLAVDEYIQIGRDLESEGLL